MDPELKLYLIVVIGLGSLCLLGIIGLYMSLVDGKKIKADEPIDYDSWIA